MVRSPQSPDLIDGGGNNQKEKTALKKSVLLMVVLTGLTIGAVVGAQEQSSFDDVPEGHYAEDAIEWAVAQGVTVGIGNNRFGVGRTLTRYQAVTFLCRAFAPSACTTGTNRGSDTFEDVPKGHWADFSVGWAVVNGITRGISATEFGGDRSLLWEHALIFAYRATGITPENREYDPGVVQANNLGSLTKPEYDAVVWARAALGLYAGDSETTYLVHSLAKRDSFVLVLCRTIAPETCSGNTLSVTAIPTTTTTTTVPPTTTTTSPALECQGSTPDTRWITNAVVTKVCRDERTLLANGVLVNYRDARLVTQESESLRVWDFEKLMGLHLDENEEIWQKAVVDVYFSEDVSIVVDNEAIVRDTRGFLTGEGKWNIQTSVDELTEKRTTEARVRASKHNLEWPWRNGMALWVSCFEEERLHVSIWAGGQYVYGAGRGDSIRSEYRFTAGNWNLGVQEELWAESAGDEHLQVGEGGRYYENALHRAKRLQAYDRGDYLVRAWNGSGREMFFARFPLEGAKGAVDQVLSACGLGSSDNDTP